MVAYRRDSDCCCASADHAPRAPALGHNAMMLADTPMSQAHGITEYLSNCGALEHA
jgi:hypothetical protein